MTDGGQTDETTGRNEPLRDRIDSIKRGEDREAEAAARARRSLRADRWRIRAFSAVFMKEMLSLARQRRFFLARFLVLTALVGVMLNAWSGEIGLRMYDFSYYMTDLSSMGFRLFMTFVLAQLAAVVLVVPALTAPVVAAERENNTLSLLLMTNLDPRNILLDKLLSRMALLWLLLAAGLPVFIFLLAFGGITPGNIAIAYSAIFAATVFACSVGLLISTHSVTVSGALVASYVALVALFGGLYALVAAWMYRFSGISIFASVHPLAVVIFCYLIPLFVFSRAIRRCAAALPNLATGGRQSWLKRRFDRLDAFFERINFTHVTVMKKKPPLRSNALVWREMHTNFLCSNIFMFRLGYTLVIVTVIFLIAVVNRQHEDAMVELLGVLHYAIITLAAMVMSCSSMTRERGMHTMDLVMASPVPGGSVIDAKFAAIMRALSVPVFVPVLSILVLTAGWYLIDSGTANLAESAVLLFIYLLPFVAWIPFVVVTGMFFSVVFRRFLTALAVTVGALICVVAGPLVAEILPVVRLGMLVEYFAIDTEYQRMLNGSVFLGALDMADCIVGWCVDAVQFLSPAVWARESLGRYGWGSHHEGHIALGVVIMFTAWVFMLLSLRRGFDRLAGRR